MPVFGAGLAAPPPALFGAGFGGGGAGFGVGLPSAPPVIMAGFGSTASSTSSFAAAAAGGGGDDDGEGEGGAVDETELAVSSEGGPTHPIPLYDGETIVFTESRAKLLKYKAEDKAWGDLGIGILRVVVGAARAGGVQMSSRIVFSSAVGVRERVLLTGALAPASAALSATPSPDPNNKAGGLTVVASVPDLTNTSCKPTRVMIKVRTQAQQDAVEKAIRDSLARPPGV